MEAVNRGAREADGISVGLNIELPYEQTAPHLTHQLHFHHFSTRKLMLTRYSRGFVIFPVGLARMNCWSCWSLFIRTAALVTPWCWSTARFGQVC